MPVKKLKQCKICPEKFQPRSSLQKVCSPKCALELVRRESELKRQAERRAAKKRLLTRHEHIKLAQQEFNRFIKLRDAEQACISCGTTGSVTGAGSERFWHAGHYRTVGAAPELRFDELNCHRQCVRCNTHKSGNIVEYRKGLLARIGEKNLEWLEGPHEPKKYTIDELKEIRARYKAKWKELGAAEE